MNRIVEIKVWAAIQGVTFSIKRKRSGQEIDARMYWRGFDSQGKAVNRLSLIVYHRMLRDTDLRITPFMCTGCAGWTYRPK